MRKIAFSIMLSIDIVLYEVLNMTEKLPINLTTF